MTLQVETKCNDLAFEFRVDLLFPDDYSDFVAEICYKDRLVLVIVQERGPDELDVEFASDVRGFPDRMPLDRLEEAISYAKRRLHELRKDK